GAGSGTIGILGDSNSIVRIYASSLLIRDKNEKVQSSSSPFFSYKQYTFINGYWDYAANSGNGGLVEGKDPEY
ncbi:MAG: hypothetical protein GX095_03980, partial [Clostridiales bacterium]|nr:hypothetical protein [Clostridiales bacterium]